METLHISKRAKLQLAELKNNRESIEERCVTYDEVVRDLLEYAKDRRP